MHDDDADLFAGVPPLGLLDDPAAVAAADAASVRTAQFPGRAELEAMPRALLVEYVEALQKECVRFDGENKFLHWEAQSGISFFSRAAKLAHSLNASSLETIVSVATNEIAGFFNCGFAAMFVHNPGSRRFELAGASPDAAPLAGYAGCVEFLGKLFASRADAYIADYDPASDCLVFEDGETFECRIPENWAALVNTRALVFPLRARREDSEELLLLGGLVLGDAERALEGRDAEAAQFFADLLSSSLHNAQLVERLNSMSTIDPLTNIFNRRHLLDQLDASMLFANRYGHDLCIAMLDIDFFKSVNDKYGHVCGDEVLRTVASVIRDGLRNGGDVPARYGGEEFLVVMPFTGLEAATDVAERLRRQIRDRRVKVDGREIGVTCSVGVTQYMPGECLEDFVDRADTALYGAKHRGRNQVVAMGGI